MSGGRCELGIGADERAHSSYTQASKSSHWVRDRRTDGRTDGRTVGSGGAVKYVWLQARAPDARLQGASRRVVVSRT